MKSVITLKTLYVGFLLGITQHLILPKLSLLLWICVLMVADVITGLLKAKFQKEIITSGKARRTVIKFLQYFGCIGLTVVLINQNQDNKNFVAVMEWAKDGIVVLIIYIECLSVFENLYAMDTNTPLSKYFIKPIYYLLSLAVKNNFVNRAQDDAKKIEDARKKDQAKDADGVI